MVHCDRIVQCVVHDYTFHCVCMPHLLNCLSAHRHFVLILIFDSRLWTLGLWLYLTYICISTCGNCFIVTKSMILYLIVILKQDSHRAETAPYINKSTLKPTLDVEYNFLIVNYSSIHIAFVGRCMRLFLHANLLFMEHSLLEDSPSNSLFLWILAVQEGTWTEHLDAHKCRTVKCCPVGTAM